MINFSKIPANSLLGRLARWPLSLLPRNFQIRIFQGPLRGCRWIIGAGTHGYWLGTYELEKQQHFTCVIRPGWTVFDVGAHVGFYTILASLLVGNKGAVFSFEPLLQNIHFLGKHITLNRLNNVTVIEAAVGRKSGIMSFTEGPFSSMGSLSSDGNRSVSVMSLDDLFRQGKIPPPNVIKIDIEGGEFEALIGAEDLLRSARPIIYLATHGPEIHSDCVNYLLSLGYHLQPLNGSVQFADELIAYHRGKQRLS